MIWTQAFCTWVQHANHSEPPWWCSWVFFDDLLATECGLWWCAKYKTFLRASAWNCLVSGNHTYVMRCALSHVVVGTNGSMPNCCSVWFTCRNSRLLTLLCVFVIQGLFRIAGGSNKVKKLKVRYIGMLMRLESLQSWFFLSIPGKEFLDLRESRLTRPPDNRPIVSGIIVTGRSALAISRSLVASRRPWPACQTHGRRRRETKDSGVSKR